MRIEHHPKLNVWVREDGCVYIPQNGPNKAHWTFGCRNSKGYLLVRIKGQNYYVHRLVTEAFLGEIPEGYEIDHINRDRASNFVKNLRIITRSQNSRNRADNDRVESRGGTHKYEDEKKYMREQQARYCQNRRMTHRRILFSNGSRHWIPNEQATGLLKLSVKERVYGK